MILALAGRLEQGWFRDARTPSEAKPTESLLHDDLHEPREGYNKLREAVRKLAAAVEMAASSAN